MAGARSAIRRHLGGAVTMILGSGLVFGAMLAMNASQPEQRKARAGSAITFSVQRQQKPRVERQVRQRPRPRRAAPRPRAPLPSLGVELSGIDVGIPSLGESGLEGASDALLGNPESALKDMVMTEKSVDVPPRPVVRATPEYPPRARAEGVTGQVTLKLLIGAGGEVLEAQVVDSSPRGVFEDAARAAALRWRFEPARYRGQAVKVWARQKVRFDLG